MRVRIIKPIASAYGGFSVGTVADVPADIAKVWCRDGVAMQDKSLDGPRETKTVMPAAATVPAVAEAGNVSSRIASLRSKLGG